jgi:hypothetical protein
VGLEGGSNTCCKSQGQFSSRFAGTVSIISRRKVIVSKRRRQYKQLHSVYIAAFTALPLDMMLRIFKHDARRLSSNVYYVTAYVTQRLIAHIAACKL